MNNESPYWSGIPEGSVELAKTVWDWGKPELECLIQTFKFPGQFGTHIDFPGHFIKSKALSEKYDVNDLIFPLVVIVSYPRIEGATGLPARVWAITE